MRLRRGTFGPRTDLVAISPCSSVYVLSGGYSFFFLAFSGFWASGVYFCSFGGQCSYAKTLLRSRRALFYEEVGDLHVLGPMGRRPVHPPLGLLRISSVLLKLRRHRSTAHRRSAKMAKMPKCQNAKRSTSLRAPPKPHPASIANTALFCTFLLGPVVRCYRDNGILQ